MQVAKQVMNNMHGKVVFQRRVKVLAQMIAGHIASGDKVLDVGCGDGTIAQAIAAEKPGTHIEGIDVFLRPEVKIPARTYDGLNIPFETDAFDYVIIVDVLHHTDDPQAVLTECARVARKGVVVKDHFRDGVAAGATLRFMDWVGNRGHDVRLPYNYLSRKEWKAMVSRLGLSIERLESPDDLYPFPFNLAFGRGLHFVMTLR